MKIKFLALVLCFFIIAVSSVSRSKNVPFERDEISWYFHTEFFDEAFIKKDFTSPLWQGYESYDHPQISKYIYGAYLYFQNHNYAQLRDSLKTKYGRWNFYYENIDIEFMPIITSMRNLNSVLTLFILIEIYLLFYLISYSVLFSLLTCTLISIHPLFVYSTAIATSDNHFLFFGLMGVIFYFQSLKNKGFPWILASSVSIALSTGSKLTGIFFFLAILFHEIYRMPYTKTFIKRISIFFVTSVTFWILINPALYAKPFQNTWRYFSFRNLQSVKIAYYIPGSQIITFSDKTNALYCTLLAHSCNGRFTNGSITNSEILNIALLIVGLYFGRKYLIFFIILVYINSMAYVTVLTNYSARYYILLQIIIFMIQIFGIFSITKTLRRKAEGWTVST